MPCDAGSDDSDDDDDEDGDDDGGESIARMSHLMECLPDRDIDTDDVERDTHAVGIGYQQTLLFFRPRDSKSVIRSMPSQKNKRSNLAFCVPTVVQ